MKTEKTKLKPVSENDPAERLRKAEDEYKKAKEKAVLAINETQEKINEIIKESGMFCGVIMGQEDLIEALKVSLTSGEPVRIPFRVYLNN